MELILPGIFFVIGIIIGFVMKKNKKDVGGILLGAYLISLGCTVISNVIYVESVKKYAVVKEATYPIVKTEKNKYYINDSTYVFEANEKELQKSDSIGYVRVKYALNKMAVEYFWPLDSVVLEERIYLPVDSLYMK